MDWLLLVYGIRLRSVTMIILNFDFENLRWVHTRHFYHTFKVFTLDIVRILSYWYCNKKTLNNTCAYGLISIPESTENGYFPFSVYSAVLLYMQIQYSLYKTSHSKNYWNIIYSVFWYILWRIESKEPPLRRIITESFFEN